MIKMSDQPNESTGLLEQSQTEPPQYIFGSSLARKRRVRQFQCCLCSILIIGILTVLIIAVAYSINLPLNSNSTSIAENSSLPSSLTAVLFTLSWPLPEKLRNKTHNVNIMCAVKQGKLYLNEKDSIEKNSSSLNVDSPSYRHQMVLGTNEKARNVSRIGYELEGVTKFLFNTSGNISSNEALCPSNYTTDFMIEMCSSSQSFQCDPYRKYRSYNGSCNNLKNSTVFGVAYRPFRRALLPEYADGLSEPRSSKSGVPLPTARTVSLEVHRPFYRADSKFTVMLAVWGQFLDHDITATALSQKQNGSSISCCPAEGIMSPDCFPVILDASDPFREYNVTCLEFVRSAPCPTCCLGSREQMNQASAFIDGSVVYGNDEDKVHSLRTGKKGLLKMYVTKDNRTLLPISEDMKDGCNREEERNKGRYCFTSGDSRANENLHLTSMHLLWARYHNLVSRNISALNPHWDDEVIFQETRRIIGALMQHITYNEFLPILLGRELMKKYNLTPKERGYFDKYNETIDPSIANEFAAAAFRFAHTIIPGLVRIRANDTSSFEFIQMRRMLFDPFKLYNQGQLDGVLEGAMNTSIEASDSYFTNELKSHLFERQDRDPLPKMCGLDLVSLNIQRGRDHGLPGYIYWKEHCGLNRSRTFHDLEEIIEHSSLENIKAIYRNVEDIDLYTGAVSEKPLNGSILGPTLTCLILDQFVRLKYGDRFWYENPKNPQSFTSRQLNEIRKTTLAKIICDSADHLEQVQPRVMEGPSKINGNIHCSRIPSPDWGVWKEKLHHAVVPTLKLDVNVVHYK